MSDENNVNILHFSLGSSVIAWIGEDSNSPFFDEQAAMTELGEFHKSPISGKLIKAFPSGRFLLAILAYQGE